MSVAEVEETKSNLKAWIDQLSDVNMLSLLDGLRAVNSDNFSWDDLSEYQKQHINTGLEDIENGRILSSSEFWSQLKNGR
jgi:hypothetical protein